MTETISSALNLMAALLHQFVPEVLQPALDAGVIQPVAHLHHQPAQQVGIHCDFQHRLPPQRLAQLLLQTLTLVVRQRTAERTSTRTLPVRSSSKSR